MPSTCRQTVRRDRIERAIRKAARLFDDCVTHIKPLRMRCFGFVFCFALAFLFSATADAQSRDSLSAEQMMRYKDPGTATLITVFMPGGGHIYAGETATGLGVLFVSAASIGAGYAYSTCLGRASRQCSTAPLYIGLGVHLANWIYSLIDAPRAAERHNRRLRSGTSPLDVRPVAARQGGQFAGGIQLSLQF